MKVSHGMKKMKNNRNHRREFIREAPATRPSFQVGDLVEHATHMGYRGIICEIVKTRARASKARIVMVSWFPPTSEAVDMGWYDHQVSGTTNTSVLDLVCLSSAGQ